MVAQFWRTSGKYGCLSNFSKHPIFYYAMEFKTSEHLYQALKMAYVGNFHDVRLCKTPKEAKEMAYKHPMVSNWETIKYNTMIEVLRLKYHQHECVRIAIENSGSNVIEEISPYDYIWGTGGDGSGLNLLGKAWMQIRDENIK